jgi:hypothetical protein
MVRQAGAKSMATVSESRAGVTILGFNLSIRIAERQDKHIVISIQKYCI